VSYRGTSLAMETMQIAQRTRSGACSYWMGADRGIFYSIFSGQRTCLGSCIHCYAYRKIFVKFLEASKEKLGGARLVEHCRNQFVDNVKVLLPVECICVDM